MEEPVDVTPYLDQLDESLRDKVLQLQKGRWVSALPPPGEAQTRRLLLPDGVGGW